MNKKQTKPRKRQKYRRRVLWLNQGELIDLLGCTGFSDRSEFLQFKRLDLPYRTRIVGVYPIHNSAIIHVVIEHKSFDAVPTRSAVPTHPLEIKIIRVKKAENGAVEHD
jgi:hypothetical protein